MEIVNYSKILCPENMNMPSVKELRDNEGLFDRFETMGSNCVLYFPSDAITRSKRVLSLKRVNDKVNGVFTAYALIEGFSDDHVDQGDPFVITSSTQKEFVLVRQNKSNKGRSKCNAGKRIDKKKKKGSKIGSGSYGSFRVCIVDGPMQEDIGTAEFSPRAAKNVFMNEKAATYGFSGMAVYRIQFMDGKDPTDIACINDIST